ncbi:SubName: Full=Uncharacterized protein {ECO:0000313/EMBL:CCA74012.1} [Serendipita indica DSM 11827]|nr:SubName: Full=Uncharacterized protein {ECO:0000313/EMBL:CCA74012.1} [Serendipita indica DSM 11827]
MPYATTLDGSKFHYTIPPKQINGAHEVHEDPNKPFLIMLHPRVLDSTFFEPQFQDERLLAHYNMIAIDHHFHGLSKISLDGGPYDYWKSARDLLAVLDALQIGRCHILGAQMGALLVLRMAILDPNRFLSIILSPVPPPIDLLPNLREYRGMRDDCRATMENEENEEDTFRPMLEAGRWAYYGSFRQGTSKNWLEHTNFRPSNPAYVEKIFSSLIDRDKIADEDWEKIDGHPVLILEGGQYFWPIAPSTSNITYDKLSKAQRTIKFIDGAPHMVSRTHAHVVNPIIADFLDAQESRRK